MRCVGLGLSGRRGGDATRTLGPVPAQVESLRAVGAGAVVAGSRANPIGLDSLHGLASPGGWLESAGQTTVRPSCRVSMRGGVCVVV
jgi:hypothetical protein